MKYHIIILLSFLILSSCKSLVNLAPSEIKIKELDKTNFQELDRTFFNGQSSVYGKMEHYPYPTKDDNIQSLVDALFIFNPEEVNQSLDINLKFKSKRVCLVSATKDSTEIFTKKLRGRFRNGYFYLRPKFYLIPLFPLLFVHNFERTRMGLTTENKLVLDYSIRMWGFALVAGGATKGRTTSVFNEKK